MDRDVLMPVTEIRMLRVQCHMNGTTGTPDDGWAIGERLALGGKEVRLDLSPGELAKLREVLAPYLEAGEPYRPALPAYERWHEDTSEAEKRWHYRVKRWATLPREDGSFAVAHGQRPTTVAGPAGEKLIQLYLKAVPQDPMPGTDRKVAG